MRQVIYFKKRVAASGLMNSYIFGFNRFDSLVWKCTLTSETLLRWDSSVHWYCRTIPPPYTLKIPARKSTCKVFSRLWLLVIKDAKNTAVPLSPYAMKASSYINVTNYILSTKFATSIFSSSPEEQLSLSGRLRNVDMAEFEFIISKAAWLKII